jgi:hypothetical protein
MGIYTNGDIFGIRIYNIKNDDINTLFNKQYDIIMSDEQINEAYVFYKELYDKENIFFLIYTECISTYDEEGVFMMWYPIPLSIFLEKFGV